MYESTQAFAMQLAIYICHAINDKHKHLIILKHYEFRTFLSGELSQFALLYQK